MAAKEKETPEERSARVASKLAPVDGVPRPLLPTDATWRKQVGERLKELGITHEELATWIGKGQSAITGPLNDPEMRTRVVWAMSVALEIPLPLIARFELAMREMEGLGDVEGMAAAVTMAEARAEVRRLKGPKS